MPDASNRRDDLGTPSTTPTKAEAQARPFVGCANSLQMISAPSMATADILDQTTATQGNSTRRPRGNGHAAMERGGGGGLWMDVGFRGLRAAWCWPKRTRFARQRRCHEKGRLHSQVAYGRAPRHAILATPKNRGLRRAQDNQKDEIRQTTRRARPPAIFLGEKRGHKNHQQRTKNHVIQCKQLKNYHVIQFPWMILAATFFYPWEIVLHTSVDWYRLTGFHQSTVHHPTDWPSLWLYLRMTSNGTFPFAPS